MKILVTGASGFIGSFIVERGLTEGHAKASVIENKLKEKYGNETHVGIHVEPVKSADGTYEE